MCGETVSWIEKADHDVGTDVREGCYDATDQQDRRQDGGRIYGAGRGDCDALNARSLTAPIGRQLDAIDRVLRGDRRECGINGAPTGSGKCLRPLEATRTYSLSIGARCSDGTGTSRTRCLPPWEIAASPCAASMLFTQSEIVPNIETTYRSPATEGSTTASWRHYA